MNNDSPDKRGPYPDASALAYSLMEIGYIRFFQGPDEEALRTLWNEPGILAAVRSGSIFALFGQAASSSEQIVPGVWLDAGKELRMQPEQDVAPQLPLDFQSRLTNSDWALLGLQALPFFF